MKRRQPQTSAPLELHNFLCFAVYATGHAFNHVYQPLLKELNLTYSQFITMVVLWDQDGLTVGELGHKLSLQSNTLTPMLKRLEILGYIKRARDAADERQVCVSLTEAGHALQTRASDIVRHVRNATGVQDRKMKQLLKDLGELRRALEGYTSA